MTAAAITSYQAPANIPAASPFVPIPGSVRIAILFYIIMANAMSPMLAYVLHGSESEILGLRVVLDAVYYFLLVSPLIVAPKVVGLLHPLIFPLLFQTIRSLVQNPLALTAPFWFLLDEPVSVPRYIAMADSGADEIAWAETQAVLLQIFAVLAYFLGYRFFSTPGRITQKVWLPKTVSIPMLFLVSCGAIVAYMFVQSSGGLQAHIGQLGMGRFQVLQNEGQNVVIANLSAIALYVWFVYAPNQVKTLPFVLAALVVMTLPFIVSGSRSASVLIPMTLLVLWIAQNKKLPLFLLIASVPVAFLVMGSLYQLRTSSWGGGQVSVNVVTDQSLFDIIEKTREEMANRQLTEGLPAIVATGHEQTGMLWGETYLGAVLFWVPRSVWPEKPRGVGAYYVNRIMSPGGEWAVPIGPVAEAYWNFGAVGVALIMFAWGGFHKWLATSFSKNASPAFLLFYVITLIWAQPGSDSLVPWAQNISLMLFCLLFLRLASGGGTTVAAR